MKVAKAAVVDDEARMLDLVEQILKEEGLTVNRYQHASELLQDLPEQKFDVIISDLMMPDLSGLDLLDMLNSMNIDTPFIITTGYASLDSAIQAVNRGAFYYLKKPFTIEEVRLAINRVRQRQDIMEEVIRLREENKTLQNVLQGKVAQCEIDIMPSSIGWTSNPEANRLRDSINLLSKLRAEGILSDEEFGEYKGRILKRTV